MTANIGNIEKYQDVASKRIINAVEKASEKTGVDFDFLMQKASSESSFNPAAKAKTSSATGLFQFIENTWLSMIKEYGDKYGLGKYADKITINSAGRPCVTDGSAKKAILDLRKNPEISALMAGEYCADNQQYLEQNTKADVGPTELYLAHFMGAGGAAKFLNSRDVNGGVKAAALFPQAAHANRSTFYDSQGRARTLDQVYDVIDNKFNDGTIPPSNSPVSRPPSYDTASRGSVSAPVTVPPIDPLDKAAQALPSFDDANTSDDIIWNDDPRFYSAPARSQTNVASSGYSRLSPANMITVLEMRNSKQQNDWYNS